MLCKANKPTTGYWCPNCKNKTEKMFYNMLSPLYTLKRQAKFDWCKGKRHFPFDFCIKEQKLLIEIDGPQHFRQISNWASPEETNARDRYKTQCAMANGYHVIRILQTDIFHNRNDWYELLMREIEHPSGNHVFIGNHECHSAAFSPDAVTLPSYSSGDDENMFGQ